MKTVLIKQRAGLGDILFTQKIAHKFIENKHRVIWPVYKLYDHIGEYVEGPNFVSEDNEFDFKEIYNRCGKGQIIENEDCIVIGLDGTPGDDIGVMKAKYRLVGIDYTDWGSFLNIKRNTERETQLINKLSLPKEYILVNKHFGTPPMSSAINERISPVSHLPQINLDISLGRPFDWIGVIESAKEIHTVETSLCYFIHAINRLDNVFVYPRWMSNDENWVNFKYCRDYFKKEWVFYGEKNNGVYD